VCGRFTLTSTPEELARRFGLDGPVEARPRYNIAPGQDVIGVRVRDGARRADPLRWGLVPATAADASQAAQRINARVETAALRPAFRSALRERRCLVPADGFYEWADRGGFRQPYYVRSPDAELLAFAGLWERWRGPDGALLESCALLTMDAAPALRDIHSRMPIAVAPDLFAAWLDPHHREVAPLLERIRGCAPQHYRIHPVSPRVNGTRFDDPGCIAPVPEPPRQQSLL
jgi:putative SOS response-associated peptidase YedK